MNIAACMVVRNEEDRYLQAALEWNSKFVDTIIVIDDGSTDGSYDLATIYTPHVFRRPPSVIPFMVDESMFRQYAWDVCGEVIRGGDWIIVIDADEFLTGNPHDYVEKDMEAASIHKKEMWSPTHYRTDGFWGDIWNIRLARYHHHASYKSRKMGCTTVPELYQNLSAKMREIEIVHAGYLDPIDRQEKYDRYSNLLNHGHSNKHIKSILTTPTLVEYEGVIPEIFRGAR